MKTVTVTTFFDGTKTIEAEYKTKCSDNVEPLYYKHMNGLLMYFSPFNKWHASEHQNPSFVTDNLIPL